MRKFTKEKTKKHFSLYLCFETGAVANAFAMPLRQTIYLKGLGMSCVVTASHFCWPTDNDDDDDDDYDDDDANDSRMQWMFDVTQNSKSSAGSVFRCKDVVVVVIGTSGMHWCLVVVMGFGRHFFSIKEIQTYRHPYIWACSQVFGDYSRAAMMTNDSIIAISWQLRRLFFFF